jgi:hypothetical protein
MFVDDENDIHRKPWEYRGYEMTEDQVRSALASASSIKEAARKINVSYPTLKRYSKMYVDPNTGKTLFDMFKNQAGRGVKKSFDKKLANYYLEKVLREGQNPKPERIAKLKEIVLEKMLLPQVCDMCGFCERRLTDMRVPLLLNFKNKNKSDWRQENLQLLCYNCFFLYIGNPLTMETIKRVEAIELDDEIYKKEVESFIRLDGAYLDHLRALGLDGKGDVIDDQPEEDLVDYDDSGEEFVDHV